MLNPIFEKFYTQLAELRAQLDQLDHISDDTNSRNDANDLVRQITALEYKLADAKRFLFNNSYMAIRSLFSRRFFLATGHADTPPAHVAKRLAFVLRPHVAMKDSRRVLADTAADFCERLGKEFGWQWTLTQGERDDSFVVDFCEPVHDDAPVSLAAPAYTGTQKDAVLSMLRQVVEQEWNTLAGTIVTENRINFDEFSQYEDGSDRKRQAVIEACERYSEHDLMYLLTTLPEADGGDFAEVLEELDEGVLPISVAKDELLHCVEAYF